MRRLLLMMIVAAATPALGAGWTQPDGDYYLKVWNRLLVGERAYFADGETDPLPGSFKDTALGFYFEYGLVEGTTLVVHGTPIGWAEYTDDSGQPTAIEDSTLYMGPLNLGVRRRLYQGESLVLAAELQVGFSPPVGDKVIGGRFLDPATCGGDRPCDFTYQPAREHARILGELQFGVPLPSGFWITGSGGFMNMTGITKVVRGRFQVGWASSFGLVVDLHSTLHLPLDDVEANDVAGSGVTEYIGFGPGFSYWITDSFGVNAGFEGVVMAKANLATPTLTLGVEFK